MAPPAPSPTFVSTLLATGIALLAFAGNSVLCRLALGDHAIDAASFTQIRLLSGAATLVLLCVATRRVGAIRKQVRLLPSVALFGYAALFSYAYVSLDTGTGALLLFGAVQLTMLGTALFRGERLAAWQWLGVLAASSGLLVLVAPGVHAPAPVGAALMAGSGVSWGIYTLTGKRVGDPLVMTAANFIAAVPLVLVMLVWTVSTAELSPRGVVLAVVSGSVTSAIGYAIWYRALRGLGTATAAVVQLSMPVIAAAGGILLMAEAASLRLAVASVLVLGGIALVVGRRK